MVILIVENIFGSGQEVLGSTWKCFEAVRKREETLGSGQEALGSAWKRFEAVRKH